MQKSCRHEYLLVSKILTSSASAKLAPRKRHENSFKMRNDQKLSSSLFLTFFLCLSLSLYQPACLPVSVWFSRKSAKYAWIFMVVSVFAVDIFSCVFFLSVLFCFGCLYTFRFNVFANEWVRHAINLTWHCLYSVTLFMAKGNCFLHTKHNTYTHREWEIERAKRRANQSEVTVTCVLIRTYTLFDTTQNSLNHTKKCWTITESNGCAQLKVQP